MYCNSAMSYKTCTEFDDSHASSSSTSSESLAQLELLDVKLKNELNDMEESGAYDSDSGLEMMFVTTAEILENGKKIDLLMSQGEPKSSKNENVELRAKIIELERKSMRLELENQQLNLSRENSWDSDIELMRKLEAVQTKMLKMVQHIEKLKNGARTRELEIESKNRKMDLENQELKDKIGKMEADKISSDKKILKMEDEIKELKNIARTKMSAELDMTGEIIGLEDEIEEKNREMSRMEEYIKQLETQQMKKDEDLNQQLSKQQNEKLELQLSKLEVTRVDIGVGLDAPCEEAKMDKQSSDESTLSDASSEEVKDGSDAPCRLDKKDDSGFHNKSLHFYVDLKF